ncbi:MAG: hypothetical protein AUK48_05265 [Oscillatoriales cyanobacterium CG2_30_44_21]|nr:MAG: hypothetical protein AUK48_05265 [Oscillatoriales cyanobacterium CG2_30_44_21]
MVVHEPHRDPYRAFFTVDEALGDYMVSLLDLSDYDSLLEPAAGDGHLICSIKKTQIPCAITAYEINPNQIANLRSKFIDDSSIRIVERDTILCPDLDLKETFGSRFTKILANPPYGGWQEYERRSDLKKRFKGFYVRETYTLFLLRCLRLLETRGKLVFIIPNTFLYLNMHAPLRKHILENFSIETIDTFKSSLFSGISFGYADLCIISIMALPPEPNHSFRLRSVDSLSDFMSLSHIRVNSSFIKQKDLLRNSCYTIPTSRSQLTTGEFTLRQTLMSEIADCKTGFYSGNDKKFLRRDSLMVNRSNGYEVVDRERVQLDLDLINDLLTGIDSDRCFVPILKGGGFHFLKPVMWYLDWSCDAVAHYKSDSKARFQNHSYYFRRGIGFPMVTSTRPTASLIDHSLFDQSIVGIFPKGIELEFLLAYCNSKPFWACLKTINPSANNSAKYVLRTPIIRAEPDQEAEIARQTRELLHLLRHGERGAEKLEVEILDAIAKYVKKQESHKILEPITTRALSQI